MTELATYTLDDGIATIALDDGKANALSIAMLTRLHALLDQAEQDGAIVVLTGRDGRFSAGFDLKVFQSGDGAAVLEMLRGGATLAERILSFPTPVVIAATGHAIAAGSFLALAADVRIGADGPFQVGMNEVKIGLTVPWWAIALARQRLTTADFDRAVVLGHMYDPQSAVAAGFFDRLVAPEQVRAEALAAAAELKQLNMAAHHATKLRARQPALRAIRAAIEQELASFDGLGMTSAPA
jgi:enoyl-CoA hydratase